MNSDCRAKTVFRTGRKSRMTCSFLALKRAEQYETMCTRLSCKFLDYFLQVPVVGAAEILGGIIDLGKFLQERGSRVMRARPPGVGSAGLVFSLPFAHCFHEAASNGSVLRELEDNGNLVL